MLILYFSKPVARGTRRPPGRRPGPRPVVCTVGRPAAGSQPAGRTCRSPPTPGRVPRTARPVGVRGYTGPEVEHHDPGITNRSAACHPASSTSTSVPPGSGWAANPARASATRSAFTRGSRTQDVRPFPGRADPYTYSQSNRVRPPDLGRRPLQFRPLPGRLSPIPTARAITNELLR